MPCSLLLSFFFNGTATTGIYTLSLHDALPISGQRVRRLVDDWVEVGGAERPAAVDWLRQPVQHPAQQLRPNRHRSEEHTSELQSRRELVCRLLLEKKKTTMHAALVIVFHEMLE